MKTNRLPFLFFGFLLSFLAILSRFFYWQILVGKNLAIIAQKQRFETVETRAPRGKIYSSDNYPLVLNKTNFSLYVYLPNCQTKLNTLSTQLSPILVDDFLSKQASVSADLKLSELIDQEKERLKKTLSSGKKWIILKKKLTENSKEKIDQLKLDCLEFEPENFREYPESSMSAQMIGFVGFDKNGNQKGYFGLEGFYDQQLSGLPGLMVREKTLIGQPIFSEKRIKESVNSGLNLTLYLDRVAQFILEEELKKGIDFHGAVSGWGVIIDPETGGVLAMASFPNYHPGEYTKFDQQTFSNPVTSEGFEPGSIFKPLVVAAALEERVITPETKCDSCAGPRNIGGYQIKTWNEEYHPQTNIKEIIKNSDNVGMVFISEKLGKKKLLSFVKEVGFGQKTGIDLQGEAALPLRPDKDWYPVDLATLSFGQGISVTPIQITRTFTIFANQGWLVKPKVVKKVWLENKDVFVNEESKEKKVISSKVAKQVEEMMVNAVENGETKRFKPPRLTVAGKTGTAQISIQGHYDQEKTIASFIGFAPVGNPKMVMLISLREPTSSPWGSETAAPVWFEVATRLAYYWNLL